MAKKITSRVVIRKPKIVNKNLAKEKAVGLAYSDGHLVEIDPNQSEKEYFLTLYHELSHLTLPDLSEANTIKLEKIIGGELWKLVTKFKKKWKK